MNTVTEDTPLERPSPRDQLRELRVANRLRTERLQAAELDAVEKRAELRRKKESFHTEWVAPYLDLYTNRGDTLSAFGPSNVWQRKYGQNYPLYRNEGDLALLRFPSRWLCATNNYAIGLVNGLMGYVLGEGITYQAEIRAEAKDDYPDADDMLREVQKVIDDVLEKNEWYGGEEPGMEDEAFWRSMEDGEFFIAHYPQPDGTTFFRFIEPDQVREPVGDKGTYGHAYSFGILTKEGDEYGGPQEYNVYWDEALQSSTQFSPERMTHFRRNAKRSNKRGVPEFSFDTYEAIDQASKLCGNVGEAAAQQASLVAVMKFKSGTQSEIQAVATAESDYWQTDPYSGQQVGVRKSRRGMREYLPDSQEYTSGPAATNATAHLSVLQGLLRSAATRWNAPEWLASADSSNNNYSSSLTAEKNFLNRVKREQRRYCATFRRMMLFALQHYAETKGGIAGMEWDELFAVIDVKAIAPAPVAQEPLEEAQIAAIEIPLGVQSRQAYMREKGRDVKQIEADNEAHVERTMELMPDGDPTQPGWKATPEDDGKGGKDAGDSRTSEDA